MNLREIIKQKGSAVHSIQSTARLSDVVDQLVRHNCGALLVYEGAKVVGIITERDVLRTCAQHDEPLESIPVEARMTRELVTARPEAPISEVMGLLTRRRIRHLPVVEGDKLVGIVSIGDIVKAQHDLLTMENHYLKEYLMG
ncbi:MAG: CBS domain-containing protein [Planctomycetales bacterium]|nr:CBS domain-containing protein [Planctomycetales bacterium]